MSKEVIIKLFHIYPVFEWIYITSPNPYISLKKRDRLRRWVSGSYTPNYSLGTARNTLHTLCELFKPLEFMSYMFMLTPKLFLCPHFSPFWIWVRFIQCMLFRFHWIIHIRKNYATIIDNFAKIDPSEIK